MKISKNFFLTTTRSRALIFCMQYNLMVLCQDCSNYDPLAKNGPAPGLISLTQLYIRKYLIKIFFLRTTRPRVLVFCIQYHLMVLYQDCSNYDPRAKNDPAPWAYQFYIAVYIRKLLKNLLLKNHTAQSFSFVCSIIKWFSTKIVQIISLGPYRAPPGGLAVLHSFI